MAYLLRRLPLSRLLLLCGLIVAIGSPSPRSRSRSARGHTPAEALGHAIHDALAGTGRNQSKASARVTLTNHLLEGASLATAAIAAPATDLQPPAHRRLRPAVGVQRRPCPPGTAVRKGRHPDLLRRAHHHGVRRCVEHALPVHVRQVAKPVIARDEGGTSTRRSHEPRPSPSRRSDHPPGQARERIRRNAGRRRRPARLYGASLPQGNRQPVRRRRALVGRRQRHTAASGDLLVDELLPALELAAT